MITVVVLWLSLTEVTLQHGATEHFCLALGQNETTGWHTVCQFVHRAGDRRGGSPSQIAGCCPKSAAHCCIAPGQKIRDSKGQSCAYCTFHCHEPILVTNKLWCSGQFVQAQRPYDDLISVAMPQWQFWDIIYASVTSFIRLTVRFNSASLLQDSKH